MIYLLFRIFYWVSNKSECISKIYIFSSVSLSISSRSSHSMYFNSCSVLSLQVIKNIIFTKDVCVCICSFKSCHIAGLWCDVAFNFEDFQEWHLPIQVELRSFQSEVLTSQYIHFSFDVQCKHFLVSWWFGGIITSICILLKFVLSGSCTIYYIFLYGKIWCNKTQEWRLEFVW